MEYPERKQKGESPEDYVRRISKLPILSPNTILRVVFQTRNQDALRYIEDCARLVFPKAFPPTDRNGYPFLNPENIPTKAFANWVVEENIFEAWKGLDQKVSPFAELFIELVNGKAIDSKQVSKKAKRKKPHSSTDRGRLDVFKNETFIPLVKQVLKENPDWQNRQILAHKKVDDALDNCGFPAGKPSKKAIKDWICIARKNAGVKAKVGRPTNQTSSLNTPEKS
jgi:hypothetical protein